MNPPSFRTTVIALAAGQLVSWAALFYTFTSFILPMQHAFGWSKPELMGAFTLGLAVWGAASYAAGAAIDIGRGREVMTWGAVLAGIGFLMLSQVRGLVMLYGAWAILGASMAALLYDPAFNILTKRFPTRYRSGITSLTLVGGFASTLSFPAAAWLIAHYEWRMALAIIGGAMLVFVAPLHAWALRGTPKSTVRAHDDDPADDATLHEALRHPSFWLITITFTMYSFAAAAMWAHMMPALAAKGRSEAEALVVVIWFGPAQVAGRLAYVAFGRWVSARKLGLVVLAALPVWLLIFAMADQMAALLVFALLFGVANGLVTIVRGSLVPEYFGREHVGRISGAMNGISLMARACAPLVTAWALIALGSYGQMLLGLAAVGLLAVIAFAMAGKPANSGVTLSAGMAKG
jgi:MFS family permease